MNSRKHLSIIFIGRAAAFGCFDSSGVSEGGEEINTSLVNASGTVGVAMLLAG